MRLIRRLQRTTRLSLYAGHSMDAILSRLILLNSRALPALATGHALPKHHATKDSDAEDVDPAKREFQ